MVPIWLIKIVVALLIVGVALWGISQIPMDATVYRVVRALIIVAVAIWIICILASLVSGGMPLIGH
jgi:hypothetical protein